MKNPAFGGVFFRTMTIYLHTLSPRDLRSLAVGSLPAALPGMAVDGALPPAFVAERALRQLDAGKNPYWCSTFLIVRQSDDAIVGACGFKNEPVQGCVEIGYGVAPACRKQGMATAAVSALLHAAFASSEVDGVLAQVNPDNIGSTSVVRVLGFKAHGTVVDGEGELLVQWLMRRSSVDGCDPAVTAR